jgi:hypothetical protein
MDDRPSVLERGEFNHRLLVFLGSRALRLPASIPHSYLDPHRDPLLYMGPALAVMRH